MQEITINAPVNIRIKFSEKQSDYFEIMVMEKDITIFPCGEDIDVCVPLNHTLVRNYQTHHNLQERD